MAVKRMPLVVGLAATGLVLSTTSVAFIGLPVAKTPSSDSSLRGEKGRMAFSSEVAQMDDLAVDATSEVEAEEVSMGHMARAALAMMAAFLVAVLPMADAHAARGGGRIGGAAPRARAAPPSRTAPGAQKERVIERNNTTVIAPTPSYGFGGPAIVYAPPTLGEMVAGAAVQGAVSGAVSGAVHSSMMPRGPSSTDMMLEGQLRQDERMMDKQAMEIENLKRQLAEVQKK